MTTDRNAIRQTPRVAFASATARQAVINWKAKNPKLPCNHRVMVEITGVARPGKTAKERYMRSAKCD